MPQFSGKCICEHDGLSALGRASSMLPEPPSWHNKSHDLWWTKPHSAQLYSARTRTQTLSDSPCLQLYRIKHFSVAEQKPLLCFIFLPRRKSTVGKKKLGQTCQWWQVEKITAKSPSPIVFWVIWSWFKATAVQRQWLWILSTKWRKGDRFQFREQY